MDAQELVGVAARAGNRALASRLLDAIADGGEGRVLSATAEAKAMLGLISPDPRFIVDGMATKEYQERLHPRDHEGRWTVHRDARSGRVYARTLTIGKDRYVIQHQRRTAEEGASGNYALWYPMRETGRVDSARYGYSTLREARAAVEVHARTGKWPEPR